MGMHLALSVMKDTLSQIGILYIHRRKAVVKSDWDGLMELKQALQYRLDLDCLFSCVAVGLHTLIY